MKILCRFILLIFSFYFSLGNINAQYDHEAVFEGKEGSELIDLVVGAYKPIEVLGYGQARDTLYGIVYNVNDSIAGIYSDHRVYLKPGEDPTTYLFKNGEPNGINAEHSYPQSKGAGNGNAKSDMHHLFPSRVATNSARGSLPFAEINDNITDVWFYKTLESSATPNNSTIDLYSEKSNNFWEPRERVKGNIARAIFYFYTMYKDQADNADPNFFDSMKETLCEWHELDPVDELEWKRTKMIANWQEGKSNPFVLDCTLSGRMYCSGVNQACLEVDVQEEEIAHFSLLQNPVIDDAIFSIEPFDESQSIRYNIYTIYGELVTSGTKSLKSESSISIPMSNYNSGSYVIQWIREGEKVSSARSFIIIKL